MGEMSPQRIHLTAVESAALYPAIRDRVRFAETPPEGSCVELVVEGLAERCFVVWPSR